MKKGGVAKKRRSLVFAMVHFDEVSQTASVRCSEAGEYELLMNSSFDVFVRDLSEHQLKVAASSCVMLALDEGREGRIGDALEASLEPLLHFVEEFDGTSEQFERHSLFSICIGPRVNRRGEGKKFVEWMEAAGGLEGPQSDASRLTGELVYSTLSKITDALPNLRNMQKLSDQLEATFPTPAARAAFADYFNSLLKATGHAGLKVSGTSSSGELRYLDGGQQGFAIAWKDKSGEEHLTDAVPTLSELDLRAVPTKKAQEQPTLKDLRLNEVSIKRLVAKGNHDEVRSRFVEAREKVGINALQPAFDCYQMAIGAFSEEARTGLSKEAKREMVSRLNSLAQVLCAVFEFKGVEGRLDVSGPRRGTFQVRALVGRKRGTTMGIGQGLPLLRLRAFGA